MRYAVVLMLVTQALSTLAAAQDKSEAKLVVQQGGREIGRETFSFRDNRGRGLPGTTITASARYPVTNPTTQLTATLERTPEGALAKFQLDVESGGLVTVILAAGSGARLIVRTVAQGSESGRELPGGPDVVLLDDQVFSLYAAVADLATPAGRPLTAIFPRSGKRASFSARLESGGNGAPARIALTGGIAGTLLTNGQGRVERLELPGQGLIVAKAD
jgi:hypothetical protein